MKLLLGLKTYFSQLNYNFVRKDEQTIYFITTDQISNSLKYTEYYKHIIIHSSVTSFNTLTVIACNSKIIVQKKCFLSTNSTKIY